MLREMLFISAPRPILTQTTKSSETCVPLYSLRGSLLYTTKLMALQRGVSSAPERRLAAAAAAWMEVWTRLSITLAQELPGINQRTNHTIHALTIRLSLAIMGD